MQRPARGRYHPRVGAGAKGDAEAVQRYGESAAQRFDEGFLTSPAVKKARGNFGGGKLKQLGRFFGREEPSSDILEIAERAMLFDIDADLTTAGKDICSEVAGVGRIESQRAGRIGERGFAVRANYELDRRGVHA